MLPGHDYNVTGTTDFRARLYKLNIVLSPADAPNALPIDQRQKTVTARLAGTILLKGALGTAADRP